MKEELKYNTYTYFKRKYGGTWVVTSISILALIALVIFACTYKIEMVETYSAESICEKKDCVMKLYLPTKEVHALKKIKIENKTYQVKEIQLGEAFIDTNNNPLQEVKIKIADKKILNNEIIEIKIIKQKQKLMKQFFDLMKGR